MATTTGSLLRVSEVAAFIGFSGGDFTPLTHAANAHDAPIHPVAAHGRLRLHSRNVQKLDRPCENSAAHQALPEFRGL
jgi:hypothetical protein